MTRIPDRLVTAATGQRPVRGRLTDVERRERAMLEADFERLVTDLATALGWEWMHVRPGMRANGRWWTATTGTLSRWPDLTLVRIRDRRLIFVEVKRELEQPTGDQTRVLDVLRCLSVFDGSPVAVEIARIPAVPTVEVYVWRPSDLRDPIDDSVIGRILR